MINENQNRGHNIVDERREGGDVARIKTKF
jgi:hypothetical protein